MKRFRGIMLVVLLAGVMQAAANSFFCQGTDIRVAGWGVEERERACKGAEAAIAFLKSAGLSFHADGLTIGPFPQGGERDPCEVGRYDVRRNEILVLNYEAAIDNAMKHPPAFDMPMSPELWESIVSHETAHAVAERKFAAGVHRQTASEYIAAVVQLATMPADLRKVILTRYDVDGFAGESEISMLMYQFNPGAFAVMAYRHYAALGDRGPAFITQLLREGLNG